ncbi:hypothetical protein ACQ4M3_40335 [Leptolyngbya sp. AN03gr2]|uniref:hypothetical protein n=1 Tax=unclassified Leptolyngbya TaxID=2650499 RepID=UPI003D321004
MLDSLSYLILPVGTQAVGRIECQNCVMCLQGEVRAIVKSLTERSHTYLLHLVAEANPTLNLSLAVRHWLRNAKLSRHLRETLDYLCGCPGIAGEQG